ncbi:MAG TPA: ribosome-associated translation inhibitor RaiA [Candidatus Limnocylindrales bacterium]|nr:ribosome-associated translation inhibitor RaiA [Candidatus Limnocylindrales bacterium]
MRTIVKGKNYEVPDKVRDYATRKLGRLERLLDDRSDATLELSVEQHRRVDDSHIVDVTLVIDGQTLRSSSAGPTHKAGIDAVLDKIERRAVDFRETNRVRKSSETVRGAGGEAPGGAGTSDADAEERRSQVVKVKRFDIEPMFEEDAVTRMEELGHSFFVFVNAEDEKVAILYRRRDGGYGLIEPVVGGGYTKGGPVGRSRAS